jgi:hypothetical protein
MRKNRMIPKSGFRFSDKIMRKNRMIPKSDKIMRKSAMSEIG